VNSSGRRIAGALPPDLSKWGQRGGGAHTENSECFFIFSVIIFEVKIVAEQKQA